eukprot:NODE_84_length_22349_cov_0.357888.p8 type:complete len:302 gc:universal NODE_84_length_22349_cov_0.357888:10039-10944(+)
MHSSVSGTFNNPNLKLKVNNMLHKHIKDYKIIKALGTGANATVYLGEIVDHEKHNKHSFLHHHHNHNSALQNYVAIKQLHTEDQKHVQHLTEEYCIAESLHHENIIRVLDLFYEHRWCYVSEYGGVELFKWIEDGMTTLKCNAILKQLLSAIKYLSDKGICHRDIKPENILCKDDVCRICDFGLAVRYKTEFDDEEQLVHGVEGSDPYMSPEIWSGTYRGPPVDVWAVAIVYTAMVLKKKVWCKATEDDKYYMQFIQQGRKWRDLSKLTDAALTLVISMLDSDPDKRITAKDALNYTNFNL